MAQERVRNKEYLVDPRILDLETQLAEKLGTRVHIEKRGEKGGKITIDFFSDDELAGLLSSITNESATTETLGVLADDPLMVENNSDAQSIDDDPDGELYSVSNFSL